MLKRTIRILMFAVYGVIVLALFKTSEALGSIAATATCVGVGSTLLVRGLFR